MTSRSEVAKRSVVIAGHKTSISLEAAFWDSVKDIAQERGQPVGALIAEIDAGRRSGNLSSEIRLFVLRHVQEQARRARADAGKPIQPMATPDTSRTTLA